MLGVIGHIGAEVVDLPLASHSQVGRVELTVDHHHPVLTHLPVCRARIEITYQRESFTRKPGDGRCQILLSSNEVEITADVKAG